MRATAWANTFQTLVFMLMGILAFVVITSALGGPRAATAALLENPHGATRMAREGLIGKWEFLTYCFIPLSVGMFPHLFQHWLTARRASNFKLTVVVHPVCIMITWVPCVLLGMWAAGVLPPSTAPNAVLGTMVSRYSGEVLSGLIGAGVLAAIMSSMDSQFLCLSSLFTNDIVAPYIGRDRLGDKGRVVLGRAFVVAVVAATYVIGLNNPQSVFDLGVWCFTGFAGLFPVLLAALYWPRSNKYGVIAATLAVGAFWLAFLPRVLEGGEVLLTVVFAMLVKSPLLEIEVEIMPVAVLVAISSTVLVVVTLLTPRPPRDVVEKFFPS
jgi:SSS family solute:Na+ symporter